MNITAKQLLSASAEIDKMRNELHQVMGMLMSHIGDWLDQTITPEEVIEIKGFGNVYWVLVLDVSALSLTCFYKQENGVHARQFSSNLRGRQEAELKNLRRVHASLDQLIQGIMEKLPPVQLSLEELMKASGLPK